MDNDYQRLTLQAYREVANNKPSLKLPQKNIKLLLQQISRAHQENDSAAVITLVIANMDIVRANTDSEHIQAIARLLLDHHAIRLVEEILVVANDSYNDYPQASIRFEIARYLAAQHLWQEAFAQLKAIDIGASLSKEDSDEAFIIYGAALQHQKMHRQAVEYYSRIKPESEHYRQAQLNIAVAYIRQDWWTDAHIAIKNALAKTPKTNDDLSNRLYTVMGFSQLQNGFYRDARESFRNVHIKSQYANRALLGLGMAALHQEDFIGSLNAFSHLKKKEDEDISVAEAYLLSAFALVQLKQDKTASASYVEAIAYYEQRSAHYAALLKMLGENNHLLGNNDHKKIHAASAQDPLLLSLGEKYSNLQQLLTQPLSSATIQALKELNHRLARVNADYAKEVLTKKQFAIDSYLSQSRFGLARLYDAQ